MGLGGEPSPPFCDGLMLRFSSEKLFQENLEKAFARCPRCSAARGRQCAQADSSLRAEALRQGARRPAESRPRDRYRKRKHLLPRGKEPPAWRPWSYLDDVRELLQSRRVGEQPGACGSSGH